MSEQRTSNYLLACPFCGGTPRMATEYDPDGVKWHYITCLQCGARIRGQWHSPGNDCHLLRAEVRDQWNRRASVEPKPQTSKERVSELISYWESCDPGDETFIREDILRDTIALLKSEGDCTSALGDAYRVFCPKHDTHKARYTDGRPELDDRCPTCVIESLEDRAHGAEVGAAILRDRLERATQPPADARWKFIQDESLHLVPFAMPTGAGDADIGWRVLQSHMGKGDVVIAEVYRDRPAEAIDAARAALTKSEQYIPGAVCGRMDCEKPVPVGNAFCDEHENPKRAAHETKGGQS